MLLKQQKESSHLFCSTANAWIIPVCYIYISIMVVIILWKSPHFSHFCSCYFIICFFTYRHFFAWDYLFGLVSSEPTLNGYPCSPVVFWSNSVSLQLVWLFWLVLSPAHSEITELLIKSFCLSTTYRATLLGKILDPWKPLNSNPVEAHLSQELCEVQQKSTWFPHFTSPPVNLRRN